MKRLLKRTLARMVRNERVWSALDATLLQTARFLEWERKKHVPDPVDVERQAFIAQFLGDLTVKHGPFQGMKFPVAIAATGSLLPKLLGSYELELHSTIESICEAKYMQIINIGSGEGFYAVGLARRCPQTEVLAYDTNPDANAQCAALAEANGVSRQVRCASEFKKTMFARLAGSERSLILCDCEGFEKQLFDRDTASLLQQHDVLIEVHDFVDMDISTQLRKAFAETHELQVISAIGDIKRALTCTYPEIVNLAVDKRKRLVSEDRNFEMEWFWFTSRLHAPS